MKRLGKDCRGIGGFFEEMPVLIIVLISLTLFLSSFVHAYGTYADNLNTVKTHELARRITDDFRAWDGVLDEAENADGMLSYAKLTDPNFNAQVLEDFNASALRLQYSFTITDISGYDEKTHISVSSNRLPQERVSIISITSPVVIVVSDTEHHAAWLTVRIWGWY